MEQHEIRPYDGKTYSEEETIKILTEFDDRTKSDDDGYNSVKELGEKVKESELAIEQGLQEVNDTVDAAIDNSALDSFATVLEATTHWNDVIAKPLDSKTLYIEDEGQYYKWDSSLIEKVKPTGRYKAVTTSNANDTDKSKVPNLKATQDLCEQRVEKTELYSKVKTLPENNTVIGDSFWKTDGSLDTNVDGYKAFEFYIYTEPQGVIIIKGLANTLPSGNYGRLLDIDGAVIGDSIKQTDFIKTGDDYKFITPNVTGVVSVGLHFVDAAITGGLEGVKAYVTDEIIEKSIVDPAAIDLETKTAVNLHGESEKLVNLKILNQGLDTQVAASDLYSEIRSTPEPFSLTPDGFWSSDGVLDVNNAFNSFDTPFSVLVSEVLSVEGLVDAATLPDENYGRLLNSEGGVIRNIANTDFQQADEYWTFLTPNEPGVASVAFHFKDSVILGGLEGVKIYRTSNLITAEKEIIKKSKLPLDEIIASNEEDEDKTKCPTIEHVEKIIAKTEIDTSNLLLKTEVLDAVQNYPLEVSLSPTSFWGTDLVLDTTNSSFVAAEKAMETIAGDDFIITGLVTTLPSGSYGRLVSEEKNFSASLGSANFTDGLGGKILTIPASSNGVASVLLNFPIGAIDGDLSNVKVYRGSEIIPSVSETINSDKIGNSDKITSVANTGKNYSTTWYSKYYFNGAGLAKGNDSFTALATKIPVLNGESLIFGDIDFNLSDNNFRFFNEDDDFIGTMSAVDLQGVYNGHKLTVDMPNSAYMKMYTRIGSIGENPKIFKAKSFFEVNQIKEDSLRLKLDLQKSNAAYYYKQGELGKRIIGGKFCVLLNTQSQWQGRVPIADLPSWFTDNGNTLSRALIKDDNPNGDFAPYDQSNFYTHPDSTLRFGIDLLFYKLVTDYLNDDMYIIKTALGGTSLHHQGEGAGRWSVDFDKITETDPSLRHLSYEQRQSYKQAMLGASQPIFEDVNCIIFAQGEGDRFTENAGLYYKNLANKISYDRGVVGNPEVPYIIMGVGEQNAQYSYEVELSKMQIAKDFKNVHYVTFEVGTDTTFDTIHSDYAAANAIALRLFNYLKSINVL